ncbi:four-carbon acid sugar kinase family protein [Clostridiales bacterium TF09-2AC]|nr:four-carbon acid sugar kinase family protein [Clostridiales bacterium TF09-2AC]
MIKLLILSDDFTGALDTGVHFAQNGARTKVVFDRDYKFSQDDDTEVIVIDAETRHLSPEESYSVIYNIVKRGKEAGVEYYYLKTDSALRGNIGSCLEALLEASEGKMLPFMPAYPKMNRITVKGVHYIDNMKVGESVFGKDPFNPVRFSSVRQIIGQQTKIPCMEVYACKDLNTTDHEEPFIAIYDSVTDMDIRCQAEQLYQKGMLKIMAGCAGFASVLPDVLKLNRPVKLHMSLRPGVFVISGSINPITLNQVSYAVEHGFRYVSVLEIVKKLLIRQDYTFYGSEDFDEIVEICRNTPYLIIDSSGTLGKNSAMELVRETGLPLNELRENIPEILGNISKSLLDENKYATLMITGGDTLIGFLRTMDVHYMNPIEEIMPGVVVSSFMYRGKQYEIITKSGGFGEKDMFPRLVNYLKRREGLCWKSIV